MTAILAPAISRRRLAKIIEDIASKISRRAGIIDAFDAGMRVVRNQQLPERLVEPFELTRPYFDNPQFVDFLKTDDVLAHVYQTLNAPALLAAYRGTARDRRKFTPAEIPAVTQLFTPRWVVEHLLDQTLGQLWREIRSHGQAPPRSVKSIRLCDPACGTMNFGMVAVDMLREMYRQEIACAGKPGWPAKLPCRRDQIDRSILRNNLFGIDIDPVAIDLARRSLEIKVGQPLGPGDVNLQIADTLCTDSPKSFDIIVTNPPYLASRNMEAKTIRRLKHDFPTAWRDAYTCFLVRSLDMLALIGRAGILCMHSFMFTAAVEKLRRQITQSSAIESIAHFGPGLFNVGNPGTLQTAAIVLRSEHDENRRNNQIIKIARLVDAGDKQAAMNCEDASQKFSPRQGDFDSTPRAAWIYWLSPSLRRAFTQFRPLGQISPPRQGLATTDNSRFVRYWWEVEPPGFTGPRPKWFPYAKGGRFRRWYEAPRHRVNWENDGREIKQNVIDRYPYLKGKWQWVVKNAVCYGRAGITYSYLTSGSFSARRLDAGAIFDVAGSSLFPDDPLTMLAILNSSTAKKLLAAISPTVNFQVGDLRELPIPDRSSDALRADVQRAIDLTRQLDARDETCPDFIAPEPWPAGANHIRAELFQIQHRVDLAVAEFYELDEETETNIPPENPSKIDLARRWISYALLCWLGRWNNPARDTIAHLRPLDSRLESDLREFLRARAGSQAAAEIESAVGSISNFLERDFPAWHNRLYRYRPILWTFAIDKAVIAILSDRATPAALRSAKIPFPTNWNPHIDHGTANNLAPLSHLISDRQLQRYLKKNQQPN